MCLFSFRASENLLGVVCHILPPDMAAEVRQHFNSMSSLARGRSPLGHHSLALAEQGEVMQGTS